MKYKIKTMYKNKFIKTFESFLGHLLHKNDYSNFENISKLNNGEVDQFTKNRILNVQNFNKWLENEWTGYDGSKKGVPSFVGKIDKLTPSMIEDYFFDQGVECTDEEIFDFIDKIKDEWLKK